MRDSKDLRQIRPRDECNGCEHYRKLDEPERECYDPDEGYVLVTGRCALQTAKGRDDVAGMCFCPVHDTAPPPFLLSEAGTLSRIAAAGDRTELDGEIDESF
jgi:hypothetical protein